MSNITTAYNTILASMAALYPNKTRIPNPYELEQNASGFLRDGYGVKINGTDPEDAEFKNYRYNVDISIVFTKEILRTEEDTSTMESVTTAIMEDLNTVRKDFYNVDQMGIESNLERVELGSSSGIEFIRGDKFNYASLEVNFAFSLQEIL